MSTNAKIYKLHYIPEYDYDLSVVSSVFALVSNHSSKAICSLNKTGYV
jgi:hypothetical protein